MGQVILPGSSDRQGRKRVWFPVGAMKALKGDVISRCDIPVQFDPRTGDLKTCGERFHKGQESKAEKHHATCAVRNERVIDLYLRTRHPDIMKPQDTEYAEWLARNRRGIFEGRVKW